MGAPPDRGMCHRSVRSRNQISIDRSPSRAIALHAVWTEYSRNAPGRFERPAAESSEHVRRITARVMRQRITDPRRALRDSTVFPAKDADTFPDAQRSRCRTRHPRGAPTHRTTRGKEQHSIYPQRQANRLCLRTQGARRARYSRNPTRAMARSSVRSRADPCQRSRYPGSGAARHRATSRRSRRDRRAVRSARGPASSR